MAANTANSASSNMTSERALPSEQDCSYCGKRSADLKRCMQCWSVQYCDRSCQKKHWRQHKIYCKPANMSAFFQTPLLSHLLLSVLWSEFYRKENGEHEMEFIPGDHTQETLEASQRLLKKRCTKHPGHDQFLPVTELRLEHLPPDWRQSSLLAFIKEEIKCTVRLTVKYTSPHRPSHKDLKGSRNHRMGSGYMRDRHLIKNLLQSQPCPIKNCPVTSSPHTVSGFFIVETAAHVVFDNSEAEKTTVDFFYDDDSDKTSIVRAHGVTVNYIDLDGDRCHMNCITHQPQQLHHKLSQKFHPPDTLLLVQDSPLSFIISHPHGCSKMITFGQVTDIEYEAKVNPKILKEAFTDPDHSDTRTPEKGRFCTLLYNIPTCPGSSGAIVDRLQMNGTKFNLISAPHSRHLGQHENKSGRGLNIHVAL